MIFIADFHIHSKYSIATSRDMEIPVISEYAKRKGISLVGSGDFTHPLWFSELKKLLCAADSGIYSYNSVYFILTSEVCNISRENGRTKKVHNLIFAPDFETAGIINSRLSKYGDLSKDGRPVLGISSRDLAEIILEVNQDCLIIPAHIWTPWFGLFGSKTGFDDIKECFGDMSEHIYALETGLSSDPAMNRRLSKLDHKSIISNSDAHSPIKLGREANIFDTNMDYYGIIDALKSKNKKHFSGTIEFFPEEGKYYWDGHRACGISLSPEDSVILNNKCPACGKKLTAGVLHRVLALSDKENDCIPADNVPFHSTVPLIEIIAQNLKKRVTSVPVINEYNNLTSKAGTEFDILLYLDESELFRRLPEITAKSIISIRKGLVKITPGYDGVFGRIEI